MQDIQHKIGDYDHHGSVGIDPVEGAGEESQCDIGPEENFEFAPAIGEQFCQRAAEHHANDSQADKQRGKMR